MQMRSLSECSKKGVCPETSRVEGSNYVDVNFVIDERTGRIIMMGALDNLVKGGCRTGGSEYESVIWLR